MSQTPQFHGSDLEEIEAYYHIPKEEIVCFGANVNPLGLSAHTKQILCENIDVITAYPDRNYTSLRKVIGQYCNTNPDYIVVGNGSTELISMLIKHRAPKKAMLLGPTYSEYERELRLCGGALSYYNLKAEEHFQLDLDHFCAALQEDIDLLILCNPNNPTSSALTAAQLQTIFKTCKEHDIFVMIDETYIEFAPSIEEITAVSLVDAFDNIMVLRGVSKFFAAPGLRLGYGITSNQDFLTVLKEHQNPWSLNSLGALAGELFLQDHAFIAKTKELIHSERNRMYEALLTIPELKVFQPTANFLLVQILKEGVTSFDVFDALIKERMMVRDCSSFESLDGEFFRFCIMMPEENTRLIQALQRFFK